MAMSFNNPRILLIDSYDSFTYNLASLCRQSIPDCCIHIIKNDDFTLSELHPHLRYFSAIIVGPGPGSPDIPGDIGVVKNLWKLDDDNILPIFGVCLGLQSLAIEFGARLKRLNVVKHGQVSQIRHGGIEIFKGVAEVNAVRYHSLHVELEGSSEIEQLAWADDGEENGKVVMAAKHKTKPFWAVQYHPESVCTEAGGLEVLLNFWRLAKNWTRNTGRQVEPWDEAFNSPIGPTWPHLSFHSPPPSPSESNVRTVTSSVLDLPELSTVTVCESFGVSDDSTPFVALDSAAQPGRFSIIASLQSSSPRITYFVGDSFLRVSGDHTFVRHELDSHDIWSWLTSFVRSRKAEGGSSEVPFWGGLIGYLSYELGVDTLSIPLTSMTEAEKKSRHPDVNLVFVERSVVLDSFTGKVHVQSIIPGDDEWVSSTASALLKATSTSSAHVQSHESTVTKRRRTASKSAPVVTIPDKDLYISRINLAKEHLFAGDSYELCLTAQTRIAISKPRAPPDAPSSSWELFKTLRHNNPAPYSAYIRLHPSTLLSSSPERFLSYSRPPHTICQLRPIKGTVRKAPGITRAIAEQALVGSTKEVAENLMIVDLIRHDLHGVVGEDVQVKQFCRVEEYETVWQLVSVIEGRASGVLPDGPDLDAEGELGWEVLKRSLPPGSMTGAPKKRSVEILQTLEDHDRSIYSGVLGYWCVGGGGDWSVIIRSCFKHDNRYEPTVNVPRASVSDVDDPKEEQTETEVWTIGAGGAITALSDPDAEWDEMVVKLQSALKAFGATVPT